MTPGVHYRGDHQEQRRACAKHTSTTRNSEWRNLHAPTKEEGEQGEQEGGGGGGGGGEQELQQIRQQLKLRIR